MEIRDKLENIRDWKSIEEWKITLFIYYMTLFIYWCEIIHTNIYKNKHLCYYCIIHFEQFYYVGPCEFHFTNSYVHNQWCIYESLWQFTDWHSMFLKRRREKLFTECTPKSICFILYRTDSLYSSEFNCILEKLEIF